MKNTNIPAGAAPERTPRTWEEALAAFVPGDAREAADCRAIRALLAREGAALRERSCEYAHWTASSIIVSRFASTAMQADEPAVVMARLR